TSRPARSSPSPSPGDGEAPSREQIEHSGRRPPAPASRLPYNSRWRTTMKRSAALTSLSHDHHHALDVARRLRRAAPEELDAARASLLEFWEPRGRRHFEIEERVLLTAIDDSD